LNSANLVVVHSYELAIKTHNLYHAWNLQDWQPIQRIKSAKYVAREERRIHLLNPIGPAFAALVERQKPFIAVRTKVLGDIEFLAAANLECEP
jgi:hypothetical protein